MEPEKRNETRQDRGVSALILCLTVLLCASFVACLVLGAGFIRILRIKSATASTPAEDSRIEIVTEPPASAAPEATQAPVQASASPEGREELELNVQSSDQMQLFASIPDIVEKASSSVVGVIQYNRDTRT